MSLRPLLLVLAALLTGCSKDAPCETLCRSLVMDCEYAAFPTLDSCVEGCLYDQDQGADIKGEMECMDAAACDPIGTVECAREFNPSGS